MLAPPLPEDEEERLHSLLNLELLDTPLEERFERITRLAKQLFGVPIVAISLVAERRQWFKSIQGLDVCETSREASFCGHTILDDEIFVVNNALLDERFADNPLVTDAPFIRFYAGYPIRAANGKKVGAICLIDDKPRDLNIPELEPLKDIGALVEGELRKETASFAQNQLVTALDRAKRAALIDPLTRMWNREGMTRILSDELERRRVEGGYLGVAIADVDHFKAINDSYGHDVGDEVLRVAAKRLIHGCRATDAVGRWGGEEFLLVFDAADQTALRDIAERFRCHISTEQIGTTAGSLTVTITVGVSSFEPNSSLSLEQLVKNADQALYEGKQAGRNRVVFFDSKVRCS